MPPSQPLHVLQKFGPRDAVEGSSRLKGYFQKWLPVASSGWKSDVGVLAHILPGAHSMPQQPWLEIGSIFL